MLSVGRTSSWWLPVPQSVTRASPSGASGAIGVERLGAQLAGSLFCTETDRGLALRRRLGKERMDRVIRNASGTEIAGRGGGRDAPTQVADHRSAKGR